MSESEHHPQPILPQTHLALEALFQLAAGVCQEITAFQPDLLVSLAHSDIGPLHAAQTCWVKTQNLPFPPMVRINLGVEKQSVYENWRANNGMDGYDSQMAPVPDARHFQFWMSQNKRYQVEFHTLLDQSVPGGICPQRILILDEISNGATRELAFGLLYGIYPQAELRFIAGFKDWTNALGEAWLKDLYPPIWEDLQSRKRANTAHLRFPTDLHSDLKQAVVGSEDCDPDSLYWQPIQPTHPAIQALTAKGISLTDCLSCARWVQAQIEQYITQRVSGEQPSPVTGEDEEPGFKTWPFPAEQRAWIEIWAQDGISISRWAEICAVSRHQARKALIKEWQFHNHLRPSGFGARTRFRVDPIFLPEPPEAVVQTRSRFLQLCDGQILAQGYPSWYINYADLITAQVDVIINLTTTPSSPEPENHSPDTNPDWFYTCCPEYFPDKVVGAGQQITIQNFPIQPFTVPSTDRMTEILNTLDRVIADGKKVYLHDRRGDERVGLVLGCYLIRHGMAPKSAVKLLNDRLAQTFINAYRIPGTEAQYRFILRWKTGQ